MGEGSWGLIWTLSLSHHLTSCEEIWHDNKGRGGKFLQVNGTSQQVERSPAGHFFSSAIYAHAV